MNKTVYICNNCMACERIVDYVKEHGISCNVVNISNGGTGAPFIAIFPALYIDGKLMAYGEDIPKKLSA